MISIFNVILGCVKVGREYSATSFLTLAQLTHISGKISHGRRCSGIHSNNEFTAGSWCTESERSRCRTCCSLALNQFHLHQKVRNKMCRFSAIQAHTARSSFQRLWNTLPMDICQLPADSFKTHLHSFLFNSSLDFVLFLSICTVLFLSEVTGCCLLYDFLGAHLLTHS